MILIPTPEEAATLGIHIPQPPEPVAEATEPARCLTCEAVFEPGTALGIGHSCWDAGDRRWSVYWWTCGHNDERKHLCCPACQKANEWVCCPACGREEEYT